VNPIFCIPTANAPQCSATFAKWRARGYHTAAYTDGATPRPDHCDLWIRDDAYPGWPAATNLLLGYVLRAHPEIDWLIAGGDDMDPDPQASPQEVALACTRHFGGTFGVMQPTGDPLGLDASGRCAAERICGSPWLGREFIARWQGGSNVFCERMHHYYADELLCRQTSACGLLWQRKDLTHFHRHPSRTGVTPPAYMRANQAHWAADEAVFREFERQGFPADPVFYQVAA
jgi:hypothetical protein